MKRSPSAQSTTAAPVSRIFTTGRLTALVVGLGSPATAVTLPASVHALGHYNMALAVTLGAAPAVLALLALVLVLSLLTIYFTALAAALSAAGLVALSRLLRIGSGAPVSTAQDVISVVINPLIALGTMSSLSPVLRPERPAEQLAASEGASPLPAVPGAARIEAEPFFRKLAREMPRAAGGLREATTVPEPVVPPSRGRHARPETAEVQTSPESDGTSTDISELDTAA